LGVGVGGLGLGVWPQTPKPQSPIPNPQSPIIIIIVYYSNKNLFEKSFIKKIKKSKKAYQNMIVNNFS